MYADADVGNPVPAGALMVIESPTASAPLGLVVNPTVQLADCPPWRLDGVKVTDADADADAAAKVPGTGSPVPTCRRSGCQHNAV